MRTAAKSVRWVESGRGGAGSGFWNDVRLNDDSSQLISNMDDGPQLFIHWVRQRRRHLG